MCPPLHLAKHAISRFVPLVSWLLPFASLNILLEPVKEHTITAALNAVLGRGEAASRPYKPESGLLSDRVGLARHGCERDARVSWAAFVLQQTSRIPMQEAPNES